MLPFLAPRAVSRDGTEQLFLKDWVGEFPLIWPSPGETCAQTAHPVQAPSLFGQRLAP